MDSTKLVNMIDVALTTIEKGWDSNPILVDFCLVCGLHEDCDNATCKMQHCSGFSLPCTEHKCSCDKKILTKCQYTDILKGINKRYHGKHIMKLSSCIAEWCKKCHTHVDCELNECFHDHCVCTI